MLMFIIAEVFDVDAALAGVGDANDMLGITMSGFSTARGDDMTVGPSVLPSFGVTETFQACPTISSEDTIRLY